MNQPNSPGDMASRYHQINTRIDEACKKQGRKTSEVTLIAVSKTKPLAMVLELYELGHRDFGENYAQELIQKSIECTKMGISDIRFHMIGHLQTNKVKTLIGHVASIQSVDSIRLASEINHRACQINREKKMPIFLEVNVDRESTKTGFTPDETLSALEQLRAFENLSIEGLMAIPAPSDGNNSTAGFTLLKDLSIKAGALTQRKLSMGMTSDFEAAIACGSTHIRIGTAIFGERNHL